MNLLDANVSGPCFDQWFRACTITHSQAVRAFTNCRRILHYLTRITEISTCIQKSLASSISARQETKAFHHSNRDKIMSQAASHGWPEPPHLAGRPIDTAILLSRDYRLQIDTRITSSSSTQETIPSIVFISFSINIEGLIDVLCDRVGIQRTTGDLLPNLQAESRTLEANWPQAPDLRGRLLDTALLLARDHTHQLRYHIESHPDEPLRVGIPVNVYFPYSRNVDLLIKALCQYGQIPLKSSSPMPKLDAASNYMWAPPPDPGHVKRALFKDNITTSSPVIPWKVERTASAPGDPPHPISSTQRRNSKHMKQIANFHRISHLHKAHEIHKVLEQTRGSRRN